MTTTRYYSSVDGGAPAVSGGSTGSLLAALRACLVTGYGSKDPAGWTEPFSGTNKAVFRNSAADGGTGCYVRVVDDVTTGTRPVSLETYSAMSTVDAGSDGTGVAYLFRAPASSTASLDWFVIADELTFYCTVQVPTLARTCFAGAGDAASLGSSDGYRYFVMGETSTSAGSAPPFLGSSSSINGSFGGTSVNTGLYFGRDYTGMGGASPHGLLMPMFRSADLGGQSFPPRPALNAAAEVAFPLYAIRDTVVRARLRGLYCPVSDMRSMLAGEAKSGDGFGGPGSVCRALRRAALTTGPAGLWVESALSWSDA